MYEDVIDYSSPDLHDPDIDGPRRPVPPAPSRRTQRTPAPDDQHWTQPLIVVFGWTATLWLRHHYEPNTSLPIHPAPQVSTPIPIETLPGPRPDSGGHRFGTIVDADATASHRSVPTILVFGWSHRSERDPVSPGTPTNAVRNIEASTRVEYLHKEPSGALVRVLDGRHEGKKGWVRRIHLLDAPPTLISGRDRR